MIIVDWFQKETFSERILSYYSNHLVCHKIDTIYNLIDRAILLSHPKYHQKNLELCVRLLCENGYLLTVIFETINKRIKKLITTKLTKDIKEKMTDPENENKRHFFFPYVRGISEITASLVNKSIFTVGFRILNNMNTLKYKKMQQT